MTTTPPEITVRAPGDPAEALAFIRLACRALLAPLERAESWLAREGAANLRVGVRDGQLVGGLAVQRMGQWFGGRCVPCGVVRVVAVAPEARGQRVAEAVLRATLTELRADGVPLAVLYPATQVLYRRAGFEQAGSWATVSLPLAEFDVRAPARARELEAREVGADDPAIRALYAASARQQNGLLDRNAWLWQRVLDPMRGEPLAVYLLGPSDAPEGYVAMRSTEGDEPLRGTLEIHDRALRSPAALARLRSLLAEHRSVLECVRLAAVAGDPLLVGLPNQRQRVERCEDWMLRIVDVPAALRARGYAPVVAAEVHLAVRDEVLAPNQGRWVLRVRDGHAEVLAGGEGRVEIDVRGLAAMYTGFASASQMALQGYLTGDAVHAEALGALLAGPAPWMPDFV